MKFLIAGCGSIGRRHIQNLISLNEKNIIGFDIDKNALDFVKKDYSIDISDDFEKSLKKVDTVFICTPNHLHTKYAIKSLEKEKNVFIEKPISHKLKNIDRLKELGENKNVKVQVGYNLRYHPLLLKTKEILEKKDLGKIHSSYIEYGSYLPNWRENSDYQKNYSAHKSMGGGILLDDVHEINYAVWLFGKIDYLFCLASKISNLKIDTEDNADILCKTKKGFNVHIHLDYLQRKSARKLKIVCEKGVINGDLNTNHLKIFQNDKIREYKKGFCFNDIYIREIKDFVRSINSDKEPLVGIDEAIYDLKIVLAAKKSSEKKRIVKI